MHQQHPHPHFQHPQHNNHQQFQPRRSISTVTRPNREVNQFYQHNFPHKYQNGNAEIAAATEMSNRPSIMSGQSNLSNQIQHKDTLSFDPIRFSPPNVTPPPSFPTSTMQQQQQEMLMTPSTSARNRVRFDDLPNYPQPNYNHIPPRKCSLAPNFFSANQSHHMYPDQYTPRTWQTNEFMSQNHHQSQYGNQNWMMNNGQQQHQNNNFRRNQVQIKVETIGEESSYQLQNQQQQQHQSNDFMDMTSATPSGMLSPIKMEIDHHNNMSSSNSPYLLSTTSQLQTPEQKRSHPNVPTRKASLMALKSQLRTPRSAFHHFKPKLANSPLSSNLTQVGGIPYTPPPILAPMRNGSGLFCSIAKNIKTEITNVPSCSSLDENNKMILANEKKRSEDGDGPSRKNGFYIKQMNQPSFADELEQLRKESGASTSSSQGEERQNLLIQNQQNMNPRDSNHLSIPQRKQSVDPSEILRKASCLSECYYDFQPENGGPHISDPNPHINIGREYQARVRKWNDREVHDSELEAIEDRDECVFNCDVLNDIDPDQITAFELLANSQACRKAGSNKEFAIHLLMENNGNIEAAVEDLLRCDTLDWRQYPSILNHLYNDCAMWTPDEVFAFQDAIYKSEKDFYVVANELPGKTVRECVQFYYTWKKVCPDDYRKLRNLRRKRQLLEINMKMEDVPIPMKKCSLQESIESDVESVATDGSGAMDTSAAPQPFRDRAFTSPIMSSPRDTPLVGLSPIAAKDLFGGIQKNYQPTAPRHHHTPSTTTKKGAQPSADGFFHCRLCDKCFEKVKSLNAHMKSHAMKARAEQEAKSHEAQLAATAAVQLVNSTPSPLNPFANNNLGISIPSTLGSLTPQQLTPQQLNLNLQIQSQLNSLSSQFNSQLNSPLTPQQQLQITQQQLMARMQQNLFAASPVTGNAGATAAAALSGIAQPHAQHPLLQAGLHSIH
ncbi:unnamed protein product [Caenorhabditis angaria]|uniref:Uncharacterized protein n=1 Tax=Caenorhabditis angaria TaxID=860376 RepID=A0A9P1N7W1_9PELO|nr:unnamed protein product [Caenorhabditis angaria]